MVNPNRVNSRPERDAVGAFIGTADNQAHGKADKIGGKRLA